MSNLDATDTSLLARLPDFSTYKPTLKVAYHNIDYVSPNYQASEFNFDWLDLETRAND